jgi:hypothetical protein
MTLVEAFHGGVAMAEFNLHGRLWELTRRERGVGDRGLREGGGVSAHGCLVRSYYCSVWCVCEEEDMEKKEREEREKEKRKREKEKERKNGKFAKPGNFRREK